VLYIVGTALTSSDTTTTPPAPRMTRQQIDAAILRCAIQVGVDLQGYIKSYRELEEWSWCLEPTRQYLQGK
jgi:hypothetical protein